MARTIDNHNYLMKILTGESAHIYFGDCPSLTWRQGRQNKAAKNAYQTRKNALDNIEWYLKHSYGNPKLRALAGVLDNCAPNARCLNGACPICMRAAARAFVKIQNQFICNSPFDFVALNICPPELQIPFEQMQEFKTGQLKNKLDDLLYQSGFSAAFGGLDYSFNEDYGKEGCNFAPHVWLFVFKHEHKRFGKKLRQLVGERTALVSRPVWAQNYNGDKRALAYAFKNNFDRRVRYYSQNRCNTRKRTLTVDQKKALALSLSREPLAARFYFYSRLRVGSP